jgi:hypothetical protein
MKRIIAGIGLLALIGTGALGYHSYQGGDSNSYERGSSYHHNYRHNSKIREEYEDPCDKLYECLDKCPTVAYKKCLEKCKEKYPDCDEI